MIEGWIACTLLVFGAVDEERLRKVEAFEFEATRGLATNLYETGRKYYIAGYRKEAIHFLKRCLEIRPNNGPIRNLVRLLQDYDNPIWRKKKWRSPMQRVASGFTSKSKKLDETYTKALVYLGNHSWDYRDDPALLSRARAKFVRALELHGGPFEVDPKQRLDLGVTTIPPEPSAMLIDEELVRVNDRLVLRDSMLRSIQDAASVREARGEHFVVRTIDSTELAERLLPLMEAAWDDYVARSEQDPGRTLGLFVFPNEAAYREYCVASGQSVHQNAAGFANNRDSFAVTFDQPGLEQIAVHEGAHLFFYHAFHAVMPSWWDEGLATSYGGEGTMEYRDGRLTTHLPMATPRIVDLLDSGIYPLKEFGSARASDYINRDLQHGRRFYTQAWALYTFLRETRDKRFLERFAEWQGFALGSGVEAAGDVATSATALFDRLFTDVLDDLEVEFTSWLQARAGS